MKSPFSGMDPYLEAHWRGVRVRLMIRVQRTWVSSWETMMPRHFSNTAILGALAASLLLPAFAHAQTGGGNDSTRSVRLVPDVDLLNDRQALQDIQLSDEKRSRVNAIIDRGQADARAAVDGYADATSDERQRMTMKAQAAVGDAQSSLEAALMAAEVATLARKVASAEVAGPAKVLAAQRKAVDELDDLDAESRRELLSDYDAATEALDADAASAAKVKDLAEAAHLKRKAQRTLSETLRRLQQLAGPTDSIKVTQAGMRASMRVIARTTSRPSPQSPEKGQP